MSKKTILLIILGATVAVVLVIAIIMGLPGRFLQGALYNIRPIYTECRIEGKNYNSQALEDCEQFQKKFQEKAFPDGEYTIFTKYVSKALSENIIPIKIDGANLSCNYIDNGYIPKFTAIDPKNALSGQELKNNDEIPLGSNGLILQLNYQKNGQTYFYDTNICESAFRAKILDSGRVERGQAKMDFNGFINSRPLVNEILITDQPYFAGLDGKPNRNFQPGNIFLTLDAAPTITFKMIIPCSVGLPEVTIPNVEAKNVVNINFQGLPKDFLDICESKLYLSFQNTNRYEDIQVINNIDLVSNGNDAIYQLKVSDLARVVDPQTTFPISFKLSLHLRERSDSNEVFTLGDGVLTVSSYSPNEKKPKIKNTQNEQDNSASSTTIVSEIDATRNVTEQIQPETIVIEPVAESDPEPTPEPDTPAPVAAESLEQTPEDSKVRHSAEPILVNPEIPGASEPEKSISFQ